MKPQFFYCNDQMRQIWKEYGVVFSINFCRFFSEKIVEILKREAGLKPSTRVSLSSFKYGDGPMYEIGKVSKINTAISILPAFYDPISFCWQSKYGRIIKTTDSDFDPEDLECWVEGLKPLLYIEALNDKSFFASFKTSDCPFELTIKALSTHINILIELTSEDVRQTIINSITSKIESHNKKSEKMDRSIGVVHNYSFHNVDNRINLRIDLGTAGVFFIKEILKAIGKYPEVTHVSIDL